MRLKKALGWVLLIWGCAGLGVELLTLVLEHHFDMGVLVRAILSCGLLWVGWRLLHRRSQREGVH